MKEAFASLRFDPRLLMYGTTLFWVQFALRGWLSADGGPTGLDLASFAVASAIVQVVLAAVVLLNRSFRVANDLIKPLSLAFGAASAMSLVLLLPALMLQATWLCLAAGLLFGASAIVSYTMWGILFSRLDGASILFNVSLAQAFGALLVYVTSILDFTLAVLFLAVLAMLSGMAQASVCTRPRIEPNRPKEPAQTSGTFGPQLKSAIPLALVFISSVITGALSFGSPFSSGGLRLGIPVASMAVSLLFLLLHLCGKVKLYTFFVVFPLFVCLGVFAVAVAPAGMGLDAHLGDLVFFLLDLSNIYGFAFLCMEANNRQQVAHRYFVIPRLLMAAALAVGHGTCHLGYDTSLTAVSYAALFVVVLVSTGTLLRPLDPGHADGEALPAGIDGAAQVDAFAARHALSKREAEVLQGVVGGYQATYIASQLCISENTVRTHLKSIYRKCGVSARNDLVALYRSEAQG